MPLLDNLFHSLGDAIGDGYFFCIEALGIFCISFFLVFFAMYILDVSGLDLNARLL
jgi:hypothetical protein